MKLNPPGSEGCQVVMDVCSSHLPAISKLPPLLCSTVLSCAAQQRHKAQMTTQKHPISQCVYLVVPFSDFQQQLLQIAMVCDTALALSPCRYEHKPSEALLLPNPIVLSVGSVSDCSTAVHMTFFSSAFTPSIYATGLDEHVVVHVYLTAK